MTIFLVTAFATAYAVTEAVPETMQAFVADSQTSFAVHNDWPTPALGTLHSIFIDLPPGAGEVLLRVHYSSVNPADTRTDALRNPKVLGSDVSGTVVAVGSGVTRLSVGDEVWGDIGANAKLAVPFNTTSKELGGCAVALKLKSSPFSLI